MAKIPYQCDSDEPIGPKGKTPWITLNGVAIEDSQTCMELLAKKYHKDMSSHLTDEEKATARAIQIMVEEHLYWAVLIWRWIYNKGHSLKKIQTGYTESWKFKLARPLIIHRMKEQAMAQGMGRHKKAEVIEMGLKDLKALSTYLGSKPFFMGQKATEVDCAVFGMLAQILWNSPDSPYKHLLEKELKNLKGYCLRMKETYWPDWDSCLLPVRY